MWLARAVAPLAGGLANALQKEPLFNPISLHALRIHRYTSHAKAKAEVGFDPRPTYNTLVDTYAWFREASMLGKG